jgi:large subunit ribosomal protein L21
MYAVFQTGGKQYKAQKGDVVFVEKLDLEPGKAVSFEALMLADGDDVLIGTPTVDGAMVKAKVIEHGKERKVVVFKYKPKIHERIKQGHRQPFTKLSITGIVSPSGKADEMTADEETAVKKAKPVTEKKPAAKAAEVKETAEKKPAAAKTAKAEAKPAAKPAAEKKPAAKKAEGEAAEKKPAAKKTAAKPAAAKEETK